MIYRPNPQWLVALGEHDPLVQPDDSDWGCHANNNSDFLCTRSEYHEMPHVATETSGIIVAIWDDQYCVQLLF